MPGGCLVVGSARDVLFANDYFLTQFGYDAGELTGRALETLLTPASRIFYDSYVEPTLRHQGSCSEAEVTFFDRDRRRCPVVANLIVQPGDNPVVIWCNVRAEKRDKAYHELVKAREELRAYAAQLQELAATDSLTGLKNRREFEKRSQLDLFEADQAGHSIGIVLIDVDHFKSFNDRFGHAVGDEVLVQLGRVLLATCRSKDTVARYGGEEFIYCLNEIDAAGSLAFAKRVQLAVAEVAVQFETVTISVGIAVRAPGSAKSLDAVILQADTALYRAKCAGRNRIVIHDPAEPTSA